MPNTWNCAASREEEQKHENLGEMIVVVVVMWSCQQSSPSLCTLSYIKHHLSFFLCSVLLPFFFFIREKSHLRCTQHSSLSLVSISSSCHVREKMFTQPPLTSHGRCRLSEWSNLTTERHRTMNLSDDLFFYFFVFLVASAMTRE